MVFAYVCLRYVFIELFVFLHTAPHMLGFCCYTIKDEALRRSCLYTVSTSTTKCGTMEGILRYVCMECVHHSIVYLPPKHEFVVCMAYVFLSINPFLQLSMYNVHANFAHSFAIWRVQLRFSTSWQSMRDRTYVHAKNQIISISKKESHAMMVIKSN